MKVRLILLSVLPAAFAMLPITLRAQNTSTPTREYVRIGSRMIAIEASGSVELPPSAGSIVITNASGTPITVGNQGIFKVTFTDPNGASDLSNIQLKISPQPGSVATAAACVAVYYPASNAVALLDDTGTAWTAGGGSLGAVTPQNSQCQVLADGNSKLVSSQGNTLVVQFSVQFTTAFHGTRGVYTSATDLVGESLLDTAGTTFTVDSPPSAGSVIITDTTGAIITFGEQAVFKATLSDPDGVSDIGTVLLKITPQIGSVTTPSACLISYNAVTQVVQLADNAGTSWSGGALGTAAPQNSQCQVLADGNSKVVSSQGTSVVVQFSVQFFAAYQGQRGVFVGGSDVEGSALADTAAGSFRIGPPGLSMTTDGTAASISAQVGGWTTKVTLTPQAQAGHRLSLKFSNTSSPYVKLVVLSPTGSTVLSTDTGITYGFIQTPTLTETGAYTIGVTPQGSATVAFTLSVWEVVDQQLTIDSSLYTDTQTGSALALSTSVPGQKLYLTFSGVQGTRLSMQLSNVTVTGSSGSVLKPDGSTLETFGQSSSSTFVDATSLATTGTYTIVIAPSLYYTGAYALYVYMFHDLTNTLTANGPTVSFQRSGTSTIYPGQNGSYTFSGTQNARLLLSVNPLTVSYTAVKILTPSSTTLTQQSIFSTTSPPPFIDVFTLPSTGTYTVSVDPTSNNTGYINLTLYSVAADYTGTLTSGAGLSVTTTSPGQNLSLTFSATSGQAVTVAMSGSTFAKVQVKVLNPDGTTVVSGVGTTASFSLAKTTLMQSGTFTVFVDPLTDTTGTITTKATIQ